MYEFSIVHLRTTYRISKETLLAFMADAALDGDWLEVEAYEQVLPEQPCVCDAAIYSPGEVLAGEWVQPVCDVHS